MTLMAFDNEGMIWMIYKSASLPRISKDPLRKKRHIIRKDQVGNISPMTDHIWIYQVWKNWSHDQRLSIRGNWVEENKRWKGVETKRNLTTKGKNHLSWQQHGDQA